MKSTSSTLFPLSIGLPAKSLQQKKPFVIYIATMLQIPNNVIYSIYSLILKPMTNGDND